MPGIFHFDRSAPYRRGVSRRLLIAGTAAYAGMAALGPRGGTAQGTATPGASPIAGSPHAAERLGDLLSRVPAGQLGGPDPSTWLFTWVDVQAQFIAFGDPDPSGPETPIVAMTSSLVSQDPLIMYGTDPGVKETFGFSTLEAHQVLVTGSMPNQVTYYAGGLPTGELPAIWEAAGYARKQGAQGAYWTVGEDGEVDLASPVGRFGAGMLNNVAIIDDVVVFAPRLELIEAVQALVASGGESAAAVPEVSVLLGTLPVDAVNVIAVPGPGLDATSITPENPGMPISQTVMDLLAESDDAVGPMPVVELAFFGVTAGTPVPEAGADTFMFADLLTGSPEDAAQAAAVVTWRVEHMHSPVAEYAYDELLVVDADREAASGPVATMAFTSPQGWSVWGPMLGRRDVWPFVYMR